MELTSYLEGAFGVRGANACATAPSLRVRIALPSMRGEHRTGPSADQLVVDFPTVPASGGSV